MANQPQQYYYIVATCKHLIGQKYTEEEIIEIFDNNISEWAKKYEQYFLCLEHGELGNNPHFNLIIRTNQTNTNLQKLFKNAIYRKHNFQLEERTVRIRLANDLPTLLTGYLEKEDEYKILLNMGPNNEPWNLLELRKHKVNKPKKIHKDLIKVTLDTAPHLIYEYIHENGIIYNEYQQPISSILDKMFKDGYAVLNLIKHSRLIKHALNTLFELENQNNLGDYIEGIMEKEEQFYHYIPPVKDFMTYQQIVDLEWDNYLEGTEEQEPLRPCVIDTIKKTKIKVKF